MYKDTQNNTKIQNTMLSVQQETSSLNYRITTKYNYKYK